MWSWLSEKIGRITFSGFGNAASILSFAITLYLFYAVRKIKSFYVSKARIPELTEQLREYASRLVDLHRDFKDSKQQILLEIGKTEVTLMQLKKKVGRPTRKSVTVVLKLIQSYGSYNPTQDHLWRIYVELQKLIQEIMAVQSDRSWENPNG